MGRKHKHHKVIAAALLDDSKEVGLEVKQRKVTQREVMSRKVTQRKVTQRKVT
jgi:hypothetical protein